MKESGPPIWIVDDDATLRRLVARWIESDGHVVESFPNAFAARAALADHKPRAVLLDIQMPGENGLELLEHLAGEHRLPVVMLTSDADVSHVVRAMRSGAYDYLSKPPDRQTVLRTLRGVLERTASTEAPPGPDETGIVGASPAIAKLRDRIARFARSDATVLIQGESGTGKELVARALHLQSDRRNGPFVAINSAAIPDGLQEAELFGHERGAFTGAMNTRAGRFQQAAGGTLFLDEVGELGLTLQAKLLRVLQERRFFRVGGDIEIAVDVRVVAATHKNLGMGAVDGSFRQDLLFRLAVLELDVPTLRDRRTDIPLLVGHFLRETGLVCDEDAMRALLSYDWPGNIRELMNALERAVALRVHGAITLEDLPPRVFAAAAAAPRASDGAPPSGTTEREWIHSSLRKHDGNVSEVIRELGIPRTTFYRKLKKHGLL